MQYVSTRGKAASLTFDGVTLAGLARDGGLYVPAVWPAFTLDKIREMATLDYADLAYEVIHPFVGLTVGEEDLRTMLRETYGVAFRHDAVAPLTQLSDQHWLLELFHGPTLAFKDFALQLLGRFFDEFTRDAGEPITIVGATSGDTGSAAIDATRGRENVRIFMLHPRGRVSEVQRRQMTTIVEPNVTNIAVEGTFDDCQAMVKDLFNDHTFRDQVGLTAVNSINWARVMAQVVYYFYAALRLGGPDREVAFSVPTGNFGDVFAGYVAKRMGLPISTLVIATNSNDILVRTLETGRYERGEANATISPSMDIQVASNFERILFDLADRDGDRISEAMQELSKTGGFELTETEHQGLKDLFVAEKIDDNETRIVMGNTLSGCGELIDPHTAVGLSAAQKRLGAYEGPIVTLATAHPAKFGDAVFEATGINPELPPHLADLMEREEVFETIPNDLSALRAIILGGSSE